MNVKVKKNFLFLLLGAMLMLSACALPGIPPNPSNPMYSVAVLPFYNATNDVDGPRMVREMTEKKLVKWHYKSSPLSEVDQLLRDKMGVTLGAQLDMTTPQKLGETLGVDGVLYGYLLNFDQITTGLYNVKKVRGGVRLVDTKTGRTVWAKGQGVKSELKSGGLIGSAVGALKDVQDVREGIEPFKSIQGIGEIRNLDNWYKMATREESDILKAGMMSLGEKLVAKALKVHLKPESDTMLDMIFSDFPAGPGGPGGAVAVAVAAPEVKMPEPQMPSFGYYGYMELGKRDFSADFVTTVHDDREKRDFRVTGSFAMRGDNARTEFDTTDAMKDMPPDARGMWSKMGAIFIGKEDTSYMLFHGPKKYSVQKEKQGKAGLKPKIDREKAGEETVGGHPSVKYKVTVTDADDGSVHHGYIWEAKDLGGFVVRTEFEEQGSKSITEFKNIVLKSPAAELFNVPKDYTKTGGMMDMMMKDAEKDAE